MHFVTKLDLAMLLIFDFACTGFPILIKFALCIISMLSIQLLFQLIRTSSFVDHVLDWRVNVRCRVLVGNMVIRLTMRSLISSHMQRNVANCRISREMVIVLLVEEKRGKC
jgi:hypothetical protein